MNTQAINSTNGRTTNLCSAAIAENFFHEFTQSGYDGFALKETKKTVKVNGYRKLFIKRKID